MGWLTSVVTGVSLIARRSAAAEIVNGNGERFGYLRER
jgi:hypothetical protein